MPPIPNLGLEVILFGINKLFVFLFFQLIQLFAVNLRD